MQTPAQPTSAQQRSAGAAFLAIGIAFLAIGIGGQPAFTGVGIPFLTLGIVFLAKARVRR